MKIVNATINLYALDPRSRIPIAIQVRNSLEKQGVVFTDTGKLTSIVNENPVPVGKLTWWDDVKHPEVRMFRQELPEVQQ